MMEHVVQFHPPPPLRQLHQAVSDTNMVTRFGTFSSHGQQSAAKLRKLDHCLTLWHPIDSTFGLLGSWFGSEVALNWLFPYPLITSPVAHGDDSTPLAPR